MFQFLLKVNAKPMKILNFVNVILVITIIISAIAGVTFQQFRNVPAVLILFVLPVTQLLIGFVWIILDRQNIYIQRYFVGVLFYIALMLLFFRIDYSLVTAEIIPIISVSIPLILATYFTYILNLNSRTHSFLTAEWNDLALINYEVDPNILEKYVPAGTELDFFKGKCYLSLIGFMFENVKVLCISVPFHTDFEEVNLRFYVKRFENGIWKRGAVFIKEIVPKHAITIVANTLYKEHYETMKMRHNIVSNEISKSFHYEWLKNDKWNSIFVNTQNIPTDIAIGSEAEFITEHYFGYTKYNKSKTIEYEVTHPRWQELQVIDYAIDVDFQNIYGIDFSFLQDLKPASAFLAIGSKITIEGKKTIS